jgi:phosphate transport system substrate-binding protein
MAAAFQKQHPGVNVTVGVSGTGGGFKKFAAGETDISNASRPIRPAEAEACKQNGIEYLELMVAWDGLTVVIHPENTWARQMTVEQLRKIWHPDTAAKKWSDVDPNWPNEELKLYGAGPDSGTFDFFTEAINGKEKLSRKDYEASENDLILVRGVAGSKYALGYFGLAYYEENKTGLTAVAIAEKAGGPFVLPSKETVLKKTYKPLSRPLFIYVKKSSLKQPQVQEFVRFYQRRNDIVGQSGYIQLGIRDRNQSQDKFEQALKELK